MLSKKWCIETVSLNAEFNKVSPLFSLSSLLTNTRRQKRERIECLSEFLLMFQAASEGQLSHAPALLPFRQTAVRTGDQQLSVTVDSLLSSLLINPCCDVVSVSFDDEDIIFKWASESLSFKEGLILSEFDFLEHNLVVRDFHIPTSNQPSSLL